MPVNRPSRPDDGDVLLRQLDCAVFQVLHATREANGQPAYDMGLGAFQQGEPVAPSSSFRGRSHVQLALRNPACVLGWILPPGEKFMTPDEAQDAAKRLAALRPARKPRVRATPAPK
ncbi:hypothetical protein [Caldimonas tepidiphila]|uniref:hypothetical protein n=1 Tax=Caldimonas tepidiphila TaxID=2315841 RepID=UPI000E5C1056|nr:hypothetical protein [Caldimonas tepidiphila]